MPEEFTQVYTNAGKAGTSFSGDGNLFHVFSAEEKPTDFLSDFSNKKNSDLEEIINDNLGITARAEPEAYPDEEYLPAWEKEYLWKFVGRNKKQPSEYYGAENEFEKYYDKLFLIYFAEENRLFINEFIL